MGFQCPGEAGSAGDMDIMRKESIVPPQPDQILILPFSSYRFSPPRQPSGWELLLAAPPRVFREGRGTEGPGPSLGTVRTRISHLLNWLGGWQWWGGELWSPTSPQSLQHHPVTNATEGAYVGRDLRSCTPWQVPPTVL